MTLGKLTYTAVVAFVSIVLTLLVVARFAGDPPTDQHSQAAEMITPAQLALNDNVDSCWQVIDGQVYDITGYIPEHPTSADVLTDFCGKDASEGWHNKRPGEPHSPRARARLQSMLIGTFSEPAESTSSPASTATDELVLPSGQLLLSQAPGYYQNGRYRGGFMDAGEIQVNLQFELKDMRIHNLRFSHLAYRGTDYLNLNEEENSHAVLHQHEQIAEYLAGKHLSNLFDLYQAGNFIDDVDGYSGATLRGNKVISAMRDALNRGVYQWP